jgi:DNA-binding NtrC family response regulator
MTSSDLTINADDFGNQPDERRSAIAVYDALIDETLSVDKLARNTGAQAHILIVDDENEITIMLATVFTKWGYRVTSTHLSATALRLLQDSPNEFDLLITDKTMPGMTGIELVKSMVELKIDIPVILTTGYSDNDTKLKNVGIAAVFKKPFAMSMLKATVAELLTAAKKNTNIIE